MSDDTMPDIPLLDEEDMNIIMETIKEVPEEGPEDIEDLGSDKAGSDVETVEDVAPAPAPAPSSPPPQEELFELPSKGKKKKRQLSEKQLANLAKAREKAAIKRKALAAARKKDRELALAEKKSHIKKRKARALQQQAEIEAYAEDEVMKKEQSMWDEDKLVNLMNRTMDTYFTKRKAEKEKRAQFPVDPAVYANYQPGAPPQRSIPKRQAQPTPRKLRNPYSEMFGLTPEDEELFNL